MIPATQETPFPLRLKQARQRLGLSLRELSEKLGQAVSHVALAKYEQGEMKPSGDVLAKLCDALDRSPDYFFRPVRLVLPPVSFRKRKKFREKAVTVLLERVRSELEDYLEAEELVAEAPKPAPKFDFPQTSKMPDDASVRQYAHQLRRHWGLGLEEPIPDLVELLENHGFRVIELPLEDASFDGLLLDGLNVIVVASRPDLSVARKRWTIAHELAHAILNAWLHKIGISEAEQEHVANVFASEFLLPTAAIKRYFGNQRTTITEPELVAVKLRYGFSIEAIVYALKEHGVIAEQAHRRFYSHFKPRYKLAGEPGDDELAKKFQESPHRFRRLVLRGMAEGAISLSRAAGLLHEPISTLRGDSVPIVE